MKPKNPIDQLVDSLATLVGTLRQDDLNDPQIGDMMFQLMEILNPKAGDMPEELVAQLKEIPDKIDRFRRAAELMSADSPEALNAVADSMRQSGLLKND